MINRPLSKQEYFDGLQLEVGEFLLLQQENKFAFGYVSSSTYAFFDKPKFNSTKFHAMSCIYIETFGDIAVGPFICARVAKVNNLFKHYDCIEKMECIDDKLGQIFFNQNHYYIYSLLLNDCTPLPSTFLSNCNSSQKNVIISASKMIENSDKNFQLMLVQGPPRTGKTTTIIELVCFLFEKAKVEIPASVNENGVTFQVLLCAPSNSALDILVCKLSERNILRQVLKNGSLTHRSLRLIRLGLFNKTDDDVKKFHIDEIARADNMEDPNRVGKYKMQKMLNADIIFVTLNSADNQLLQKVMSNQKKV